MASFFNLTLDTTAPSGLYVKLDGDALYTTSATVTLTTRVSDSSTAGYQMKVWGINGVASEAAASWETFATTKSITLTSGDGLKTVYVKVRDDVGNETATVSDTITLDTTVPVVTISSGPDKTKISKVSGFDTVVFNFVSDVDFHVYEVHLVPATNSTREAGTLLTLHDAGYSNENGLQVPNTLPADTNVPITITGEQVAGASAADGVKIIKVFVKTPAGIWSVA